MPYSFSPDGKRLAFFSYGEEVISNIFTASVEVDYSRGTFGMRLGQPELLGGMPLSGSYPAFSPDGRWLAYAAVDESRHSNVYVQPFPGPGGRWQISSGGGRFPLWSRDGRELLFESIDQHVMAVNYSVKGDSFSAGTPRPWSQTTLRNISVLSNYDLAPDGRRLAAVLAEDPASGGKLTRLNILLNFADEVRRKVPLSGK